MGKVFCIDCTRYKDEDKLRSLNQRCGAGIGEPVCLKGDTHLSEGTMAYANDPSILNKNNDCPHYCAMGKGGPYW